MTQAPAIDDVQRSRVERYLAGSSEAPALVLDVGWVNGLGAQRLLARSGIRVLALDHKPSALGFRSRYGLGVRSPDPLDSDSFAPFLDELTELLPAPAVVFPTHDDVLEGIARVAPSLPGRLLCPFPAWERLELLQKKRWQLERAAGAGVGAPRTLYPGSATEARAAARELGLPLLVKPSEPVGFRRKFGKQAFRCESDADVDEAYGRAEPFAPMLQELVPGGDDQLYTVGSYLGAGGRALGVFCGRKLLQTPRGVGTCRLGEALWLPEVVDQALRLLRACGHVGISQVEFKRDSRDGSFKLMEINPRLWQWHTLAAACGVDVPVIAYRDLTGAPPPPVTSEGRRRRWAISLLPGERPVIPRPPYTEAVFSLRDPRPGFVHLLRTLKKLTGGRRPQATLGRPSG
ncbi:MAG: carboxylate--amine ligase [Gaiellaceae bacterium]